MNILTNERITLRPLEPEDLDNLYQWENNTTLWESGNTRTPYSRFQLRNYIANLTYDIYEHGNLRLMIEINETKEAIGTIDLFDFEVFHNRVSIGVLIDKKFQQQGFANSALELIEAYVFNFLKLNQIYAQVAVDNLASQKLFGARYEQHAVLKNWIKTAEGYKDVFTYQLFLSNYITEK